MTQYSKDQEMRETLQRQVDTTLELSHRITRPLGRWARADGAIEWHQPCHRVYRRCWRESAKVAGKRKRKTCSQNRGTRTDAAAGATGMRFMGNDDEAVFASGDAKPEESALWMRYLMDDWMLRVSVAGYALHRKDSDGVRVANGEEQRSPMFLTSLVCGTVGLKVVVFSVMSTQSRQLSLDVYKIMDKKILEDIT